MKEKIKKILAYFGVGITRVPKKYFLGARRLSTIKIGKYELKLKKNHSLKFNTQYYSFYNQNLPRLVSFLSKKIKEISVIDIGANIGDTVAFIRSSANDVPILCFEGDPEYYRLLKQNVDQFTDVKIFQVYLSDKDEVINAKLTSKEGTLSILVNDMGTEILVARLDSIVEKQPYLFRNVRVLKIDTDGYDMKILRGSWNFLKTHTPVLFFEYDRILMEMNKEDGFKMLKELFGIGYFRFFFYDNHGRFIVSFTADQEIEIESLHDYINKYEAPFEFYDLCAFHKNDDVLAKEFLNKERLLNK